MTDHRLAASSARGDATTPTRQMRTLLLESARNLVEVRSIRPEPGPGEVLVRMSTVGICGSDRHAFRGHHPFRRPPVVLGHEGAGVIVSEPRRDSGLRAGDRVAIRPLASCTQCELCRGGAPHLCTQKRVPASGLPGLLSEYVALPEDALYALPDTVGDDQGAMIEPLAVACHACRTGGVSRDTTVAVLGAGAIGGLTALVARIQGASVVMVTDVRTGNLDLMRAAGIGLAMHAGREDILAAGRELTSDRGFDVVVIASGHATATAEALQLVARQGTVVVLPMFEHDVSTDLNPLVLKEVRLLGSTTYTPADFLLACELVFSARIDVRPFISRRVPLQDVAASMSQLDRGGDLIKLHVDLRQPTPAPTIWRSA